jgi:hypothetical protein
MKSENDLKELEAYVYVSNKILSFIKICAEFFCSYSEKNSLKVTFQSTMVENKKFITMVIIILNTITFKTVNEKIFYDKSLDYTIEFLNQSMKFILSADNCKYQCAKIGTKIIQKYNFPSGFSAN